MPSFQPPGVNSGFGGTPLGQSGLPPKLTPAVTASGIVVNRVPLDLNPVMPPGTQKVWQHVSVGLDRAVEQMEKRQSGELKSLKTPWSNFDDVGLNGMEWHTQLTIGARPGIGKSLVSSLITTQAHNLNPDQDFLILDFQFEMLAKNMGLREISSHMGMSVKALNSAKRDNTGQAVQLAVHEMAAAKAYVKSQQNRKHFVVETPLTAKGMEKACRDFYKVYKLPFIATLDHTMLVPRGADEKDKLEVIQETGNMCTRTKREMPIFWIVLSQLSRDLDSALRQEKPGTQGNYPVSTDLFGADAMMQHSDIVGLMNRPSYHNLTIYGPDKFVISKPNLIAMHFIKTRSDQTRISFFEADYAKMNLYEVQPPPRNNAPTRGALSAPSIP